jgi:hypothetical protein
MVELIYTVLDSNLDVTAKLGGCDAMAKSHSDAMNDELIIC